MSFTHDGRSTGPTGRSNGTQVRSRWLRGSVASGVISRASFVVDRGALAARLWITVDARLTFVNCRGTFAHMRHVDKFTVFIRALRGHPVEHQRKLIEREIKRRGASVMAEYIAGESGDDRDEWIRQTRATEGAMVAGLYVIPEMATKGKRPSADLTAALIDLALRCALIVDAEHGISSADGKRWRELVEKSAVKTAAGRSLSRKAAQRMARTKWAKTSPGVVERWTAPNMRRELARWQQHWRDPMYSSAEVAFGALPDEIRDEFGSMTTARRVLGKRRPHDPTAGGRPPAKKRKQR